MTKKIFFGVGGLFLFAVLGGLAFVNSAPELPAHSEQTISEVLSKPLPEFVTGETGYAQSGKLKIWYESRLPQATHKGTVLLVMGHSTTAMLWPEYFIQPLVDAGYQVVRYDNRGVGMSDWVADWNEDQPYSLEDMAKDGLAVLDALGVQKAHIIGASMGGMIAQRLALSHSDRVHSLCSIMSSGYMFDPEIKPIDPAFERNFLKYGLKFGLISSEKNAAKMGIALGQMLKGTGDYEVEIRSAVEKTLYELRKRKGFNLAAQNQHTAAIMMSGSRLDELANISVPTLLIHGKSDPLVGFEHAERYATRIPKAKKMWFDGMGHDLPKVYMVKAIEGILENMSETEPPAIVPLSSD